MRLLHLLLVLAATVAPTATAASDCPTPRVRKAWRMLSSPEKQVYQDAVASAVASGEFIEFTNVHEDHLSQLQAHQSCAFLVWHKRFLLAFENMLRAQSPASRCVTVPYWDAMTEYAQMVDGACANIHDCAAIVRELGAGSTGISGVVTTLLSKTVTINGRTISGICAPMWPSFCDDSGQTCGCIPRGDLTQVRVPSGAGFQGLFDTIAFSTTFEDFSRSIQAGVHNDMHSQVGGFMATYASPTDPLFFSWHATIDLLLYIYHQCHLADGLSASQMQSSVYAFSQDGECRYSNDAPTVVLTSKLIQRSTVRGTLVDADTNPVVGKYFASVSNRISDLLGFATLGPHSYVYEIPDAFKKYLLLRKDKCPAFVDAVRPRGGGDGDGDDEDGKRGKAPPPTGSEATKKNGSEEKKQTKEKEEEAATVKPNEEKSSSPSKDRGDGSETTTEDAGDASSSVSAGDEILGDGKRNGKEETDKKQTNEKESKQRNEKSASSSSTEPVSGSSSSSSDKDQDNATSDNEDASTTGPGVSETVVDPVLTRVNEQDASMCADKYWNWATTTETKLASVFPGNHSEITRQMQVLECLCFKDQFGIANYTKAFIDEFRLDDEAEPACQTKVDDVATGDDFVVLEVEKFEASAVQVKPGVTPAPMVTPAPDAYSTSESEIPPDAQDTSATTTTSSVARHKPSRWFHAVAVLVALLQVRND